MIDHVESKRRQKTRLLFIRVFLQLLRERELDKISVTDIANAADYGRWTFYQYFESKEAVAYAAFLHWMNQLDIQIIAAVKDFESPRREYESWRIIFREFEQQKLFFTRIAKLNTSIWYTYAKEFLIQQFYNICRKGAFR